MKHHDMMNTDTAAHCAALHLPFGMRAPACSSSWSRHDADSYRLKRHKHVYNSNSCAAAPHAVAQMSINLSSPRSCIAQLAPAGQMITKQLSRLLLAELQDREWGSTDKTAEHQTQ
jgi:hypothetical protein